MARATVLVLLVVAWPLVRADVRPVLADEVVAVVDGRAVLLSELEIEARLQRAVDEGAGTLEMPLASDELARALDSLVDRLVVYAQAERLQVFPTTDKDVADAVAALEDRLGERELARFRHDFDVDDATLAAIVARDLRVERYLESRFRLASRPREAAVRAYYDAHPDELAGRSFDDAAPEIRVRLATEKYERLSKSFIADVRQRARVRILRDLSQPGLETPRSGSASAADVGRAAAGRAP